MALDLSPLVGEGYEFGDESTILSMTAQRICEEQKNIILRGVLHSADVDQRELHICDGFAGNGNFVIAAARSAHVTAVDIDAGRLEMLRKNKRLHNATVSKVIEGNFLEQLSHIGARARNKQHAVIVNQPWGDEYKPYAPTNSYNMSNLVLGDRALRQAYRLCQHGAIVLPRTINRYQVEAVLPQTAPKEWVESCYPTGHPKAGKIQLLTMYYGLPAIGQRRERLYGKILGLVQPLLPQVRGKHALFRGPEADSLAIFLARKLHLARVRVQGDHKRVSMGKKRNEEIEAALRLEDQQTQTELSFVGDRAKPKCRDRHLIISLVDQDNTPDLGNFSNAKPGTILLVFDVDFSDHSAASRLRLVFDPSLWTEMERSDLHQHLEKK